MVVSPFFQGRRWIPGYRKQMDESRWLQKTTYLMRAVHSCNKHICTQMGNAHSVIIVNPRFINHGFIFYSYLIYLLDSIYNINHKNGTHLEIILPSGKLT